MAIGLYVNTRIPPARLQLREYNAYVVFGLSSARRLQCVDTDGGDYAHKYKIQLRKKVNLPILIL